MDYCDLNHSERQMHKMRPRTPPLPPPVSRRNRSRSPRRRYRSPMLLHHDYHRSRDRPIDPYDDPNRNSNSRARPQESRCIGIFGLSERTTETDIRRMFSKYGYIENTTLIYDNKTRRSRGYCFVYFESMKSATRAVESSTNLRIDNRYVRVDYSITSRPRSSGSSDRYKDEVNRYASARNRSNHRRVHSPSPPRRYHR
ncbi:transformer-2 protein homolog alpha-like isoform X2 [Sitodiplosis mosellana]|nr:transformer-2 protein homolog alpha-like isoform X2 [Sitodiplosis mosellana]XP_055317487.1 transformer-2 protein homolog alpha-like isoform X2 [Sitodiplosis mosellana]